MFILFAVELRDRYRDDETAELREVKRDLETTSKNCRILQFKLRKTERRCDQLESERTDYEEKVSDERSCAYWWRRPKPKHRYCADDLPLYYYNFQIINVSLTPLPASILYC